MLHHSRGYYSHWVHMEYTRNGISYSSLVMWFQILCKPDKHSPYNYGTHNPVDGGTTNQDGEKNKNCDNI